MSLTAPYKQNHYMGEANSEAAIENWLQSNLWTHDGTITGDPIEGMLFYDAGAVVKKLKVYANGAWEIVVSGAGLDAAYVAGQTIDVDLADLAISFTGDYSFTVNLAGITNDADGFFIEDTDNAEYIRATMNNTGLGIDWSADVRSIVFDAREDSHITVDDSDLLFSTTTTGDINISSVDDINFNAHGSGAIPVNSAGAPILVGFVAPSIVGALNEAMAAVVATTLDQAYDGGGAGVGRTITADSGAVEITVSDNSANAGLIITQSDVTTNPNAVEIVNVGTGASLSLQGAGKHEIVSDDTMYLTVAANAVGNKWLIIEVSNDGAGLAGIDIDANGDINVDTRAGHISMGSTTDSDFTVTGVDQSLTLEVAGAGAQRLILNSAGDGTDALSMLASAGGITLKSSTGGTKSADIALDTVSADSTIIIGTTHGAVGQDSLVGIFANNSAAGAGNDATVAIYPHTSGGGGGTARLYLGRDKAGVLNSHYVFIKATHGIALSTTGTGDITIAAADDVSISSADDVTVSATDTLLLASTTEDVDINAATAVTINAAITSNFTVTGAAQDLVLEVVGNGTLDLNAATGAITLDAGLGISLDAVDVSNFTMSAGGDGARLTIETQGAGNQGIVISSAGNVADSIAVNATAGGIEVDALLDVAINSSTGSILIGNDAVAQPIGIGTGAAARTITIGNATANTQVNLDSGAGGKIDLDADQGNIEISTHTSGNIRLSSDGDVGISAAEDSSFSVPVAGKDLNFSVSGGGVQVIGLSSEGTGTDAVNLVATAGGIEVDALGAIAINSSGSTLNIGNDADAFGINIGTGAAARTITVGNVTLATAVNLIAGTGGITFDAHGAAAPIPINSAAAPDLAGFVAPSIVGALNELKAGPIWMNGIVVNANAYTVNAGDEYAILHVTYTATGACAITIQTAWIAIDYNTIYVKDTGRNSFANHITIVGQANEPFEGDPAGGIMKSDGAGWWIQAYNGNLYML